MQINRTSNGTVHVALTVEEAAAVRDDLGQIWASQVSTAGDQLHSLLESVTEDEPACPGFEKEYQGVSDAKRRLANCKHCRQPRTAHPASA
ncbi:hypothetical protein [Streptomyces echinatus]|uniref:Uncharacterized protein n=1 Tax=Streptomyces echinatus TaxID=67293 RepID=A0A7W9UVE0_9ACTN|nr:hypothetical protein [Streptomyces echinatus]MBB5932357.1 hypothetical protein [Streptomyces echinatus]